jgi:hypothetical protein
MDKTHDAHSTAQQEALADTTHNQVRGGARKSVAGFGHRAAVSSASMLRLIRLAPESDEEVAFEAPTPPIMTPDLAVALAQVVRAALACRTERPEPVA